MLKEPSDSLECGESEGDVCNRDGCTGLLFYDKVENCSCHISPPCSRCTDNPLTCTDCGWTEDRMFVMNDFVITEDRKSGIWKSWEPRPLDASRIDWHSKAHSNSSMIKDGVYPEGTSRRDVEECVKGTFGGRFEHFGHGTFRYIAYTD